MNKGDKGDKGEVFTNHLGLLYDRVGIAKQTPCFWNTIKACLASTVGWIFLNILILAAITALEVDELCKEMLSTVSA